jgi:hypothetical protein
MVFKQPWCSAEMGCLDARMGKDAEVLWRVYTVLSECMQQYSLKEHLLGPWWKANTTRHDFGCFAQEPIINSGGGALQRRAPPCLLRWLRLRLAPALPDTRIFLVGAWKTDAAAPVAGSLPAAVAAAARCAFLMARLDAVLRPHSRMAVTLRPFQPL